MQWPKGNKSAGVTDSLMYDRRIEPFEQLDRFLERVI
jgi:hypothetical protein